MDPSGQVRARVRGAIHLQHLLRHLRNRTLLVLHRIRLRRNLRIMDLPIRRLPTNHRLRSPTIMVRRVPQALRLRTNRRHLSRINTTIQHRSQLIHLLHHRRELKNPIPVASDHLVQTLIQSSREKPSGPRWLRPVQTLAQVGIQPLCEIWANNAQNRTLLRP